MVVVVVVVDEADRQQLLLSALNLLGYTRVQAVGSGTAARQMEQRPPDVVVLGLRARPVIPTSWHRVHAACTPAWAWCGWTAWPPRRRCRRTWTC